MPFVKERNTQLSFIGGRNTKDKAVALRPDEFKEDENIIIGSRGELTRRNAESKFNTVSASASFVSGHVDTQVGTDNVLAHLSDGKIVKVTEGSGDFNNINVIDTINAASTKSRFFTVGEEVYFVGNNAGDNRILKRDASGNYSSRNLGIFPPSAWGVLPWGDFQWGGPSQFVTPSVILGWGSFEWGNREWGGEGVKGRLLYFVTFIRRDNPTESELLDPESESPPFKFEAFDGAEFSIDVGQGTGNAVLVPLPISTDPQVTGRRVYRKDIDKTDLIRLLREIQDNTTTQIEDSLPLESEVENQKVLETVSVLLDRTVTSTIANNLGLSIFRNAALEHIGVLGHITIPAVSLLVKSPNNEMIAYAGSPDSPNFVFITKNTTDKRFQKLIDPSAIEGIIDLGGEVSALSRSGNDLIMSTKTKLFVLRDYDATNPAINFQLLSDSFGIENQEAVFEIEGRALAFFSDDTVRFLDDLSQDQGDRIRPDLEAIPEADKSKVAIVNFKKRWWIAHRTSGGFNNQALVLTKFQDEFLSRFDWTFYTGILADFFRFMPTENRLLSFSNKASGSFFVIEHDKGSTDVDGNNIRWRLRTANFRGNNMEEFLEITKMKHMIQHSGTLTTEVFYDDEELFRDGGANAAADLTNQSEWGNKEWGDFPWGDEPIAKDVQFQHRGDCNFYALRLSETTPDPITYFGSSIYTQTNTIS